MTATARFRFNGWLRILVLLSVVWVAAAALWSNNQRVEYSKAMAGLTKSVCEANAATRSQPASSCLDAYSKGYTDAWNISPTWTTHFLGGIVTLPILWIVSLTVFFVVRWIRSGFKQ